MVRSAIVPTTDDPSDHKYEVPPVAVTLMAVRVQVNSVEPVLLVMPAVGAVVLLLIDADADAVQPFDPVPVTV